MLLGQTATVSRCCWSSLRGLRAGRDGCAGRRSVAAVCGRGSSVGLGSDTRQEVLDARRLGALVPAIRCQTCFWAITVLLHMSPAMTPAGLEHLPFHACVIGRRAKDMRACRRRAEGGGVRLDVCQHRVLYSIECVQLLRLCRISPLTRRGFVTVLGAFVRGAPSRPLLQRITTIAPLGWATARLSQHPARAYVMADSPSECVHWANSSLVRLSFGPA